jgi:hypothetical protein
LAWNVSSPADLSGLGFSAVWPMQAFSTLSKVFGGQKDPFSSLTYLARLANHTTIRHMTAVFGFSPSGAAYFEVGPRSNSFSSLVSYAGDYHSGEGTPDSVPCAQDEPRCQYVGDVVRAAKGARNEEDVANLVDQFNK